MVEEYRVVHMVDFGALLNDLVEVSCLLLLVEGRSCVVPLFGD
jgi:hypothetical protein